jgi:type I restriction enzyme M protein
MPVLGLIFLRFAEYRFSIAANEIESEAGQGRRRRAVGKADYQAKGVLYVPEEARYSRLLTLPEGHNVGRAINDAMRAIETENEDLKGVLPKEYNRLDNDTLFALLKTFSEIAMDFDGDIFGRIYEYFLGKFALAEGQKGGEFYTPASLVKLIVEVIEPYHGRIYDPACGSGGMFVQSANFVKRHRENPSTRISIYGQEKVAETIKLCRLNLAVHGLSGDIKQANAYYEDAHRSLGKFDFVMANPPFNVDGVDKEKIKDDPRYPYGLPKGDNANYLWIQIFWSTLNEKGRAGFVMANSAADARASELEIRKRLIQDRGVDVIISIGSNFFYNVTLPCTLWFLDRGKRKTDRKDKVLFIDARYTFRQIDRAHRDFTPEQIEFLGNIVRLYRDEDLETESGSESLLKKHFPKGKYADIAGLCKAATLKDIEGHGWSLNPGRYVGVAEGESEDVDFVERLGELSEQLEKLNAEAQHLEERIKENVTSLLQPRAQL